MSFAALLSLAPTATPSDATVATAILDRLLHHATVLAINGDSYRMRAHQGAIETARAALGGGV